MSTAPNPERHHWINALVGVIDASFDLDIGEQAEAAAAVGAMLDTISISAYPAPAMLPVAVTLEMHSGVYSDQLAAKLTMQRPELHTSQRSLTADIEDWRDALSRMVWTAYPDLDATDRFYVAATFDRLLVALGLPDRPASHLPDDLISVYREAHQS